MDIHTKLLCVLLATMPLSTSAESIALETRRPDNFVDVKRVMPQIQTDMRYVTDHNFVGRKIDGYQAPNCLLTQPAAQALKNVEERLLPMGLTLKVYDCYRPQTAVNDFARWAKELENTRMRTEFYSAVDKSLLFSEGYIAYQSGHSRGSTMDLTIVPLGSPIPAYDKARSQMKCTAPASQRTPDNSLDMGTGFDCFSPVAHPDYQDIPAQAKANRLLLQSLMVQAGFKPLDTEWWHFTLINEPYPDTYFDFPVEQQLGMQ
ncbi:M15 family metallopeptidase [Paraburkholderia hayleyella]|uniref:M15 family metallopeptidase n=1 Tax=Paraburkholderia hayleyella TaxID=2152889 RepID=UPI001C65FAB6|nr:M15 family metallopeptidase [Paraburkholderia hayleyella]